MALIINSWANVERMLIETFAYLIQAEGWVAAEILNEIRSVRPRIAILSNYMGQKHGEPGTALIKNALFDASDLNEERNYLAHGVFRTRRSRPELIIRSDGWGKNEKLYAYTVETLVALLGKMRALEARVTEMFFTVASHAPPNDAPGRLVFASPEFPPSTSQMSVPADEST